MTDVLMAFLSDNSYTPASDAPVPFSNVMYGELVDADIGYPVLADGTPVQTAHVDRMDEVFETEPAVPTSAMLSERYCATQSAEYTGEVKLESGETVSISDYDVVFVSFLWMYYGYICYLDTEYPENPIVGIQEESVRDITACSAQLQGLHREALAALDAVVAINERYRDWVAPYTETVSYLPLLIPDDQFESVNMQTLATRNGRTVCVGIGTANMDFSNLYSNLLVVNHLRNAGHDLDAEIIGLKPYQKRRFAPLVEQFDFLTLTGYIDDGYYEHIAEMDLAVLLTTRATTGRPASEFAAVGVPCIGTPENTHQRLCFPNLCVEPFDSDAAISHAQRLLTNPDFYRRTVQSGRDSVRRLQSKEETRESLNQLVNTIT
jgi:hypothetical protein